MANPVDAVANAGKGIINTGGGLLRTAFKAVGWASAAIGVFAIVGALTSPAGLAALAPHVNMAVDGFNAALGGLSSGASWVGAKLSGVALPAPGVG